nr:MAG TPA: nucelotide kinase [Caudoviricetes sp.]
MSYKDDSMDGVEHPSHYVSDGVECIEAMYAISPAMAIYFAAGSALKYLDRAGLKDDEGKDLRKARECWHMAKRLMVRLVADGKN